METNIKICPNCGDLKNIKENVLLNRSYEMLKAIEQQWTQKNLNGDFFKLPYELNEFLAELRASFQIK